MLAEIFQNAAQFGGQVLPWIGAAIGTYILARNSFYTVPQEHQGLVTRFDEHNRTNTEPGLKMKIPFIEQVKKISMQEYQVDETLETKTTDNLFVDLPISIHFQVDDPASFHFKKNNPIALMKKVVAASVRKYTSGKDFQELYDERTEIRDDVIAETQEQVGGYGIQINDIVIDEPKASNEVKKTFDRVRSSALEKDAATNEAEADYIRVVKDAEAIKERSILIGEGTAGFREKIAAGYPEIRRKLVEAGVEPVEADRFMERAMYYDTLRDIGDKGNMVIVTGGGEDAQRLGQLQTLGQTLAKAANDTPPTSAPAVAPAAEVVEKEAAGPAAPGM